MAPSPARIAHIGSCDIYSLGLMLYELATGEHPFRADSREETLANIKKGRATPPHQVAADLPIELDRIIRKCLAKHRVERYQSMREIALDLKRLTRDLDTNSAPSFEDLAQRPVSGTRAPAGLRSRLIAGAVGLVVILALAAFWLSGTGDAGPPGSSGPTYAKTENGILQAFDSTGALWSVPIPDYDHAGYAQTVPDPGLTLVEDVDGDGRSEVFVAYLVTSSLGSGSKLLFVDDDGTIQGFLTFGKKLQTGTRVHEGGFSPKFLTSVHLDGRTYLLTVATHNFFPTQLARIDPISRQVVEDYYHPGHWECLKVSDIDEDGDPEVLLGGLNNPGAGVGHAAVAIMDLPFGEARGLDFFGNPGPRPIAYALFPRADGYGLPPGQARVYDAGIVSKNLLRVLVGSQTRLYYNLDLSDPASIRVRQLEVSDAFKTYYGTLEDGGQLDHPFTPEEKASLHVVLSFRRAPDGNSQEVLDRFAEAQARAVDEWRAAR